jgi:hypothetical protein
VRRRTWVKYADLMRQLKPFIKAMSDAGVDVYFLKGIALAPLYYDDAGLRSLGDIDVMVEPEQIPRAVRALVAAGMRPHPESPGTLAAALAGDTNLADQGYRHGIPFVTDDGVELDLHWAVLHTHVGPGSDRPMRERAVPVSIARIDGFTLAPCDHLLHVIVHGLAYNNIPTNRWVADAVAILRHPDVAIDWPVLAGEAERRGLQPPVYDALSYLAREFEAPIPEAILSRLAPPWPLMARLRYRELVPEWGDVRPPWLVLAELAKHLDGRPPAEALAVTGRFFKHRFDPTRPSHMAKQLVRPFLIFLPPSARRVVREWGRRNGYVNL